jgi:hypothetical protein
MEALRYHNARCIQQINNSKNSLTAAIVAENMALADKYVQQHAEQFGSGIPKVAKKLFARNVELTKTSSVVLSLEVKVFVFKPSMHLRVAYMSTFISSNFGIFME